MVNERGMDVHHTTILRWVQHYGAELDKRCRSHLCLTNDSWRVNKTYIKVKGKPKCLYRAVDADGNTFNFLLTAKRDTAAAKHFFRKTLKAIDTSSPRVITVDKNPAYQKALNALKCIRRAAQESEIKAEKVSQQHSRTRQSRDKTISQTWDGIWLVQHCKTNLLGLQSNEHD